MACMSSAALPLSPIFYTNFTFCFRFWGPTSSTRLPDSALILELSWIRHCEPSPLWNSGHACVRNCSVLKLHCLVSCSMTIAERSSRLLYGSLWLWVPHFVWNCNSVPLFQSLLCACNVYTMLQKKRRWRLAVTQKNYHCVIYLL